MEKKDKKIDVNLDNDFEELKICLKSFIKENKEKDQETVYKASEFIKWLKRKVELYAVEKSFSPPEGFDLKRTKVFWIDFGFNIGQEFGGKHPAIILRVSGEQVFVLPLSSQSPNEDKKDKPMYVKVPIVYDFPPMIRWANVFNIRCVSVQRIDFSSISGRVPGFVMDNISKAIAICGIR
ncbi:MAG: type II toxin-antitoxin system PemK/MazF family toxin [Bacillota bacterium]